MCILHQARLLLVQCFSISHSRGPYSFRPVLCTSRCTGSALLLSGFGRSTSKVSARRLRVVWSGVARSAKQAGAGPDQAFGLAQSQAEHGLEGQGRRDR